MHGDGKFLGIDFLVKNRADINCLDLSKNETPLLVLLLSGEPIDAARSLLDNGADSSLADDDEMICLQRLRT